MQKFLFITIPLKEPAKKLPETLKKDVVLKDLKGGNKNSYF